MPLRIREAAIFGGPFAALALALAWWSPRWAVLPGALALLVMWFFRDPERRPPEDPRLILAPADGRVVRVDGGRLSIFLSLLDVHVCRAPAAGRVARIERRAGSYQAAFREGASRTNARLELELAGEGASMGVVLVAGWIARRIVSWVEPGQWVERGQRIGMIRFGSRVDLRLPPGVALEVRPGQHVRAGQTPVARWPAGADGRRG